MDCRTSTTDRAKEVFERSIFNAQADDLPLQYHGTPITYLSLNDFLNIAIELRTAPEVLAYLDAQALSRWIFESLAMSGCCSSFTSCKAAAWLAARGRPTQPSQSRRSAMNCARL